MKERRRGASVVATALAGALALIPGLASAGGHGAGMRASIDPTIAAMATVWVSGRPIAMMAKPATKLTPEKAEEMRTAIREGVARDVKAERWGDAADSTESDAAMLGDPVSFQEAAQMRLSQADSDRDIEAARQAIATAQVALDILYFYEAVDGGETESDWRPIDPALASGLIGETEAIIEQAQTLITEIEAEQAEGGSAPAAGPEDGGKTRKKRERTPAKPGTVLIGVGSALTAIGVGGVAMATSGLVISLRKQSEVEKLVIPDQQDEVERLDQEGGRANLIAYIGVGVAAVGLGVGVPLLVVGVLKRKKAGQPSEQARLRVVPAVSRRFGGVSLQGRF